ncbi:MAG: ComEC/Rec2 family competence protein [Bacteroidota bacterium]|nr:ComEC/Rec2 family competence protein [Bacteroidota bacterium]
MTNIFKNIPFFRLMIPFVVGILLGIAFDLSAINIFVFIGLFILAAGLKLIKKQSFYTKRLFLICLDIFFLLFAINLVNKSNLIKQSSYYGNYLKLDSINYIIATINDIPTEKENFIKCQLSINAVKTNLGYQQVEGNVIGYFRKPISKDVIKVGSTYILKTNLMDVSPPQNPYEFNYKNYLFNKQIYHMAFIENGSFDLLDIPLQINKIWYYGLIIKQYVLDKLKNSELSQNAYGICAALLTGYDDDIDKQIVDSFSHSGTLHVLSVSGLHTGLIYLVLSFLFDLVDRKRKYKLLKFLLITFLLWGFALMTGFSAPVLRAVIMFNLLGFGKIFFRSDSRNQINILLVSAFILLCYNPFFITEVGFLLSYFAVFGLLYFQPKLVSIWQPTNSIMNWLWQGASVSLAATISTLPLTLFYFKQFPLWFFVCNILVVPASFAILLLALLIVFKFGIAAILVNYITNWLIAFITFFNSSKFGFIDSIDFSFTDAIFLSLFLILLSTAIQTKSYRQISFSVLLLIFWQISSLMQSYNSKTDNLLAVYQINKDHTLVVKNKTNSIINNLDSSQFAYHVKPHIISFNNSRLQVKDFNYIKNEDKNILILNKKHFWPNISQNKIDVLILANNFKITQSDLETFNNVKTIILDGSYNHYSTKKTEELCRKFGIELFKTKEKGAYILNL